jgi:TATA-binding protein-associated factor
LKSVAKQAGILSFNKIIATTVSPAAVRSKEDPVEEPKEVIAARIMRRGGVMAFVQLTTTFGSALFDQVPKMWQCVSEDLLRVFPIDSTVESGDSVLEAESGQSFLDTLTALRDIIPTLDASLLHRIQDLFPSLLSGLQSRFAVIRQSIAKCMAVACEIMTTEAMLFVVERVLPLMDDAKSVKNRQGATELMFRKFTFPFMVSFSANSA